MTILEVGTALREKKISSVELTQECLAKIDRHNPRLNALITVTRELALTQAAAADAEIAKGVDRGPLQGIPYALKDNFSTKGIRTTCGSKLFEHHVPNIDSAVTEKLAAAGAVLVGKAGLHELAYGITSNNPHFGAVRNPCDPDRIPGGSSGGSAAAVASGMALMAMGTDTGGSIRIPAAFCGITGIKPTSGRVSRYGVMPLDFSLDHMGPITQTAADAALVLEAISGYDPRDDTSSRSLPGRYLPSPGANLAGWRIGRPENFFTERVQPEILQAYDLALAAAESLGAEIMPVQVPDMAAINVLGRIILMSEASALMDPFLNDPLVNRREFIGADVLTLLDQGRLLAATDYVNAQRLRRGMQREFAKIWKRVDLLLTPTSAIVPPLIGQSSVEIDGVTEDTRMAATRFVRPFNVLGLPALSIPCGFGQLGLPIGLQIVGKAFSEARIFQAAACLIPSRSVTPK